MTFFLFQCPAFNSRFYNFIVMSDVLLFFSGLSELAVGGLIARIYASMGRNYEAFCLGHLCMGLMGRVISFAVSIFLVANSAYGTYLLIKSKDPASMSTEFDPNQPEIFCHSTIVNLAYASAVLGFVPFLAQIGLFVFSCIKKCRSSNDPRVEMRQLRPGKLAWRADVNKDPKVVPKINVAHEIRPEDMFDLPEMDDDFYDDEDPGSEDEELEEPEETSSDDDDDGEEDDDESSSDETGDDDSDEDDEDE